MKKIIVHVGYPKTATTTIQEGLFFRLHQKGIINYLGKTLKKNEDQLQINNYFINNTQSLNLSMYITDELINVYSNENIPFYKYRLNFFKTAQELIHQFDKVEIIVVLRNQADLLYSKFVNKYHARFENNGEINTIDKFIAYSIKNKKQNVDGFYLYDLLKEFENIFGKSNIHILLFEDFVNDKKVFIKELAKIIQVDASLVEKMLFEQHHNQKNKIKEGYYAKRRRNYNVPQ